MLCFCGGGAVVVVVEVVLKNIIVLLLLLLMGLFRIFRWGRGELIDLFVIPIYPFKILSNILRYYLLINIYIYILKNYQNFESVRD